VGCAARWLKESPWRKGVTVQDEELTGKVIGCAMQVQTVLGPGYLESVYENALAHELRKAGLRVECQRPIRVWYDGVVVGDFVADLWVEGRLIIENKAVQALVRAHEVQLVSYLNSTGVEVGLLLNFGASSLQYKRKHRMYRPKELGQDLQDGQD
jgi:GxxExxY protein